MMACTKSMGGLSLEPTTLSGYLESIRTFKDEDVLIQSTVVKVLHALEQLSNVNECGHRVWQVLCKISQSPATLLEQKNIANRLLVQYIKTLSVVACQSNCVQQCFSSIQHVLGEPVPVGARAAMSELLKAVLEFPGLDDEYVIQIQKKMLEIVLVISNDRTDVEYVQVIETYLNASKQNMNKESIELVLTGLTHILSSIDRPVIFEYLRTKALYKAWSFIRVYEEPFSNIIWRCFYEMLLFKKTPLQSCHNYHPERVLQEEKTLLTAQYDILAHWILCAKKALLSGSVDEYLAKALIPSTRLTCLKHQSLRIRLEEDLRSIAQSLMYQKINGLQKIMNDTLSCFDEWEEDSILQQAIVQHIIQTKPSTILGIRTDVYEQFVRGLFEIMRLAPSIAIEQQAISLLWSILDQDMNDISEPILAYSSQILHVEDVSQEHVAQYISLLKKVHAKVDDVYTLNQWSLLSLQIVRSLLCSEQHIQDIVQLLVSICKKSTRREIFLPVILQVMSYVSEQNVGLFMNFEEMENSTRWLSDWKKEAFHECRNILAST